MIMVRSWWLRKRNNPLDKIEGEGGCWGMRMRRRGKDDNRGVHNAQEIISNSK
jgi:hypothetical protein